MAKNCAHETPKHMKVLATDTDVCQDCILTGDTWVHLRLCMECGHVGCCDSSRNRHATRHFHSSHHPIVRSIEPGESWTWCYVDELMGELRMTS